MCSWRLRISRRLPAKPLTASFLAILPLRLPTTSSMQSSVLLMALCSRIPSRTKCVLCIPEKFPLVRVVLKSFASALESSCLLVRPFPSRFIWSIPKSTVWDPAQDMDLVMKSAVILDRATQIIEKHVGQPLDHSSYAYVRFVAHMRFLIRRLKQGGSKRTENSSLFYQAAKDFPDAYACRDINEYLSDAYGWSCSDEELLYLMMHVNRLR